METDNSSALTIRDLPPEILHKIFYFIDLQELCTSVSLVCKEWYEYAHSPVFWRYLNPKSQNLSGTALKLLASNAPLLKNLNLHGQSNICNEDLEYVFTNCPHIQELVLGFCSSLSDKLFEKFDIQQFCSCLTALNVEGNNWVNDDFIRTVSHMPKLRVLSLAYCRVTDAAMIFLANNLSCLESIDTDGAQFINDEGIIYLVKKQNMSLRHLKVDGENLTDHSLQAVITNCKNLQTFHVSFAEMFTDEFVQNLKDMQNLCNMKLKKATQLSQNTIIKLFQGSGLPRLTYLDLTECVEIGDEAVRQITLCCGKTLKSLMLCWCWNITDQGICAIVDRCSNLENLDLLGVDEITGSSLDRIPEDLPKLTYLNLCQCNKIDDDLINELLRRKQDLKVINYYGEEFTVT